MAFEHAGYRLADVDLDAVRFADLVTDGRRHLDQGRPEDAAADFRAALSLWRGEALADVRFAPFAAPQVTRLELERLAVIERRIAADLACGRHHDLVSELAGLVGEHPLQEGLWAHRMVALYRAGRQADALRAFAEVREILAEQLGLEPGPELRRLEEAILQQRDDLEPPPRPALLSSAIGAVASARSPIVGREDELQSLCGRLAAQRVLSLVGPAGVGKTRLAVEAAATVATRDAVEVHFVELATVTDPASVGDEIATRLGAPSLRQGDALRTVASRFAVAPCSWCWTTASSSAPPWPAPWRPFSTPAPNLPCSSPVASHCGSTVKRSSASSHSRSTRRSSCSGCGAVSAGTTTTPLSPRSAGPSTGYRSRSNWRRG